MKIVKRISWFIKEEKWSYILGIGCLALIAFLNLIPPRIMGNIIDEIVGNTLDHKTLVVYVGYLLVIALIIYAARYGWRIYIFGTSFRLERKMRLRLFEHFTKMSPSFFQEHRTGDLMAHATNDIKAIQRVAGNGVLQFADALLTGTFVLIAMFFTISWKMTLFALLPMPIMVIGARILGKKLHKAFSQSQASFSELNNRTHESISGIKVSKAFGQEQEEIEQFKKETENVYQKYMNVTKYDTLFSPLVMMVITLSYVIILGVGIILIKNGELTTGLLSTFVSYVHILIWPMMAIGFLFNTVERGNASFDRIEKLLAIEEDIINFDKVSMDEFKGDIHFNIKKFSYDNDESHALTEINFALKKGETLGIVGKTGSGKSTLTKLLLREYDNYEGQIY
ncbi:MAG TPA: ABC transporter transmembrane domain-containing protein, partial [Erysipelothrix sp.]|nr:ABC transporter transmembrane domain-containing protein [Erysipelothrix sp.]